MSGGLTVPHQDGDTYLLDDSPSPDGDDLQSSFGGGASGGGPETRQWMESSEGPLEYESDPEMWSQSDDTSLTGPEESLSEQGSDRPSFAKQKFSRHEKLRMLALRRHLDNLAGQVLESEHIVQTTREELKKCRTKLEALELEKEHTTEQLQQSEEQGNMANVHRLKSKLAKLEKELEAEGDLEKQIQERLDQAELDLSKAELEQGKFILAEEDLEVQEERLEQERMENTMQRARKENIKVVQADRRRKNRERDHMAALRERDRKHRQAMSAARRSREAAAKYLKETVAKVRQKEADEEERHRTHMDQRVRTLLNLRSDVSSNRENLRALQARSHYVAQQEREALDREREDLEVAGENAEEVMLRKQRLQQFEQEKQQHEANQKERQAELLSHLLREERQMKKRQAMYPQLWPDAKRDRAKRVTRPKRKARIIREYSGSSSMEYSADVEEAAVPKPSSAKLAGADISSDDDGFSPYGATSRDERGGSDSEDRKDELAKPEFEGLWNQQHKTYKVPKEEDAGYSLKYTSKMERDMMAAALDKHRAGIVRKQVAAGKEFKGCPFYSKPDVIHFKDFDVGKSYKKKVILTNVSYSVNFIKLVDLSDHLKDFIDLQFDPPGQMSAGMSCEMLVTFKPMINEDLEGEVQFLTQTGPFCVPVNCSTKKCDLSVDTDGIDFGTQVIGETLKKTITLTNKGAKGTQFEFIKITGMKQNTVTSAGTSLGRLTTADITTRPNTSKDQDNIPTDEKEKADEPEAKNEGDTAPDTELAAGEETREPLSARSKKSGVVTITVDDTEGFTLAPDDLEDPSVWDGMRVGQVTGNEIGPFSSVKLEIIFNPTIPGAVDVDFEIRFTDPLSETISVKSVAVAIDVPVWVERQNVDLKICMFDRLYQDAIVVNNRATTALRIKFEVCKELRNHMELLPKTAYIQAQSQFSAQLKFLPRHSLIEEAGPCFDKETGVLEAPMTIRVADQTAPVLYTVHAVVTTSDMTFNTDFIDFGYATIHESVIATVKLTNKSILSQKFGFVNLPDYVDVQPNDGFGTLLPLEAIDLDIIFSAKKAKNYSFELTCKSGINRDFKISCKAVGVHPPLELSHSTIHFAATAMEDSSVTSLWVVNSHTSANEFTHPVPRIGKGEIAPVGPTAFEFVVPRGVPLAVSPAVGVVKPGKKTKISVKFCPQLGTADIKEEAVRLVTKAMETKAKYEFEQAQLAAKKSALEGLAEEEDAKKGKKGPKRNVKSPSGKSKASPTLQPVIPPKVEDIELGSDEYAAGRTSLLRQFAGRFSSYSIPCYVASGQPGDPGTLPYNVHNTLYLEVHCPAVKPPLVVISDRGRTTKDFGDISVGQRIIMSVTIQNISDQPLELKSSILDTSGPFSLLNALRSLPVDGTHTLLIAFAPLKAKVYQEVLDICCAAATLSICLKGQGISPVVNISLKEPKLDLGYVLAGEETSETFKLENVSPLAVDYVIKLASLSFRKHADQQGLPLFIRRDAAADAGVVGKANLSGSSVFDCVPCEGTLQPGSKTEISVFFRPDHPSECFSDVAQVVLYGKQEAHTIHLTGAAKSKIMYLLGGDQMQPPVESLAVVPVTDEEEDPKALPPAIPTLLSFRALSKEDETVPASRQLQVGCIRTMAISQKKNGEFFFDNLNMVTPKGFAVDTQRGMVEAGMTRAVNITWTPPKGHDPNMVIEASIIFNLKGDVLERYNLILRAQVVTEEMPSP
ncbi:cilia- and flagella-associated protein 74-like [Acanthaster planci]|uniref:Cilia- and flagella-associated protein 74-like n=1 Tax=Acanthaster planci TaxID=133434 RepID=A0A8B7Z867_ACAPL|nr:cilia- and flagella-associated protein 74-like [Acanthaster planci]